jgi:hypothetical protein
MGRNRYPGSRGELPIELPRHTLMLLGGTGTSFTGPIWPLVEINGIESFSARYDGLRSGGWSAVNIEIISDKASVWERDWKKTADWALRWSRPEEAATVTVPPPRGCTVSTAVVIDPNEYLFNYKFPVEPRQHSVLLQESRNGRYIGELLPLAGVTGIENFSTRKRGKTTTAKIAGELASVQKTDWKILKDWQRIWEGPRELRVLRRPRARTSEARTTPG